MSADPTEDGAFGVTVAVVLVNHNYAGYVETAVDSVLSQSRPAEQVIVVDDGSTDGSVELLSRYEHLLTIVRQSNQGHGAAMNAGWARVDADVVLFLDADDVLLPGALAVVTSSWRPDLARLQWQMQVIDENGTPTGARFPPDAPPQGTLRPSLISEGPERIIFNSPPTSGNAWSVDVLRSVMPLDPVVWRIGPDTPLKLAAAMYGTVQTHPSALSSYRIHTANQTWSGSARARQLRELGFLRHSLELVQRACGPELPTDAWTRWVDASWLGRLSDLWTVITLAVPEGPFVLLDNWWAEWLEVEGRPVLRDVEEIPAGTYVVVAWWYEGRCDLEVVYRQDCGVVGRAL